jgi:16S rRNA (adenine(1408)-N(1))-methyltransferase
VFAYRTAKLHPDVLVVGVDANPENLREVSRRTLQKPSRGGVPNALFGRVALEGAPGALSTLADRLTVFLPWGTLLRAVARPDPDGLERLAAVCRKGAEVRIVFGYGRMTDPKAFALDLPSLEDPAALDYLKHAYGRAGFAVVARHLPVAEVATLPTTWAKKLAYSGKRRAFVEIVGRCLQPR